MTLVIAQRLKDRLTFSADSRLSFDGNGHFDKCIKIFNVPFRLKGPAKTSEDLNKYEFEYNYGLAVVGSSINAYTVKESISELLANLRYISNISDFSIIGIGHIVLKIYGNISSELGLTLRKNGLSEILLGGFCLTENRIRLLRFFPKCEKQEIDYCFEEILSDEGILFFGSAKPLAEKIYLENNSLKPLQILKRAIEDGTDNSIGGNLQNGGFYNENFKVNGVVDQVPSSDGMSLVSKHYLRGFELDQSKVTEEYPYLFVSYGYTPVD